MGSKVTRGSFYSKIIIVASRPTPEDVHVQFLQLKEVTIIIINIKEVENSCSVW